MSAQSDRSKLLYLFHSYDTDERSVIDSALFQNLLAYWTNVHGVQEPVLIAVSFGPAWTLTELPSAHVAGAPALLPFFVDEVMPYLESQLLGTQSGSFDGTRYAYGKSMGGYNLAQIVTQRPEKFSRALMHCPGLFTVSPYATEAELLDYVLRTDADLDAVKWGQWLLGADAVNPEEWNANDPLQVGQGSLSSRSPQLLVTYNTSDMFGFEEGAQRFIELARERGVTVEEASSPGDHCMTDSAMEMQMAEFLR
jgi:hypothetical protein